VLVAAARGSEALEDALRAVRSKLPDDARVRLGLRHPNDPLAATMGERALSEPVDGVVEVTLAEGASVDACPAAVTGLAGMLADAINPGRSAAIAGACHRFLHDDGAAMIALAARRAPGTTMDELTAWWLRHGRLALNIVSPLPLAYEQLHADADVSRAAARAAGVAETPYDMFDTICGVSAEELTAPLVDPEVARQLFEDELGHVDHATLRGAMQRVI
jgi:hypothetical protein